MHSADPAGAGLIVGWDRNPGRELSYLYSRSSTTCYTRGNHAYENNPMKQLELSTWSIVKVLFVLVAAYILWQILDIVGLLFVVFILVAALAPTIEWFVKIGVPRVLAVTIVMLLILVGLVAILALVIPELVFQLQVFLTDQFPGLVTTLAPYYESLTEGREILSQLVSQLQNLSGNVLTGIASIFGGLVSALTVLVLTFYLLLEEHPIREAGVNLFPPHHRTQIAKSFERITRKLGAWLRGQFTLSIIVGLLTALAMTLIGVPAPLAIGVLAGVLEIIPIVGPLVAGVVMLLMAAISPEAALFKVVLSLVYFVLLQVIEGQILVPKVMQKAIGISPVVIIIALLVGAKLAGVTGAILAIPLAAVLQVAAQDWPKFQNSKA